MRNVLTISFVMMMVMGCVEDGLPGETGPEGLPGETGADGDPGDNGGDGIDGTDGADGDDGAAGLAGLDGLSCWDANADAVCDAAEDLNSDSSCDHLDCQGAQGPQGPPGNSGISSCSNVSGTDTASCSGGNRLTGAFCSCPSGTVASHVINTPAGNVDGSMSCTCTAGSATVNVLCCL